VKQLALTDRNLSWHIYDRNGEYGTATVPLVHPVAEVILGLFEADYRFSDDLADELAIVRGQRIETVRFSAKRQDILTLALRLLQIAKELEAIEGLSPVGVADALGRQATPDQAAQEDDRCSDD
jgi:hypothetical protein